MTSRNRFYYRSKILNNVKMLRVRLNKTLKYLDMYEKAVRKEQEKN